MRAPVFMWAVALFGCQQPPAELFQTISFQDDQYHLQNRPIPPLTNPKIMAGEYGQMYAGGVFKANMTTSSITYEEGRTLQMKYVVEDGVFYPLDRDGLIVLSFYAHLFDAVSVLQETTLNTTDLFPIPMAITPTIPDISLAFLPMENAAYMPSTHAFILLSDSQEREVPIAANAGIVAHEFGHAVFHYLTTGGVHTPRLYDLSSPAVNGLASLDEGFADMLASLIFLDPAFMEHSLAIPARDVSGEQTAEDVAVLPESHSGDGLLALYDPYPLGSVYAAVAWDIYEGTQDQIATLNLIFSSIESFAALPAPEQEDELKSFAYQWLVQLVASATPEQKQLACASVALRFAGVFEVPECL